MSLVCAARDLLFVLCFIITSLFCERKGGSML